MPNYLNLKNFGCLCFPWLKSYTHHKLEFYSTYMHIFWYLHNQSAFLCFDTIKNKFYKSRHVKFCGRVKFQIIHSQTLIQQTHLLNLFFLHLSLVHLTSNSLFNSNSSFLIQKNPTFISLS